MSVTSDQSESFCKGHPVSVYVGDMDAGQDASSTTALELGEQCCLMCTQ